MGTTSALAGDAQFDIKHRVVGAALLVFIAVVVLPLLLDGQPEGLQAPEVVVAAHKAAPDEFMSKIQPLSTPTTTHGDPGAPPSRAPQETLPVESLPEQKAAAAPPSGAPEASTAEPPKRAPLVVVASPAAPEVAAAAPQAAPREQADAGERSPQTKVPAAAPTRRGWVVQVGVFSKSDNASRLVTQLRDAGFAAQASPTDTQSGTATKVWVGPFDERVRAARVRADIEKALGQKGFIAAYP
ncbi:MAG: hypothetical protein GWO21_03860 [Gammaproteobacteria bacterium]|nr:hypothetical protein [Gammaproteobacteria bacterium]